MNILETDAAWKIGGAASKNSQEIREGALGQLAEGRLPFPIAIVCSAPYGVTDLALEAIKERRLRGEKEAREAFAPIYEIYRDIVLDVSNKMTWRGTYEPLVRDFERSILMRIGHSGAGDKIMARIVAEEVVPEGIYLEAEDLLEVNGGGIFTKRSYVQGKELILPEISKGRIPVIGGFVATNLEGRSITLPRGGSERTLAYLMNLLKVDGMVLKETQGIRTANPGVVTGHRLVPSLTYEELIQSTSGLAKPIEEGAAQQASESGRRLIVWHYKETDKKGTIVFSQLEKERDPRELASLIVGINEPGYQLTKLSRPRISGQPGFFAGPAVILEKEGVSLEDLQTDTNSISFSTVGHQVTPQISEELERVSGSDPIPPFNRQALIAVVGEAIKDGKKKPEVVEKIARALRRANVPLETLIAPPGSVKISFYVPLEAYEDALLAVHNEVILAKNSQG